MAGQEHGSDPQIASMRIKLKYPDVDTFIQKYATNISRTGLFISSKQPKPVGTHLKFEIVLTGSEAEESVLRGEGRVQVTRAYDPDQPKKSHGMAVKFSQLDEESQQIVARVLAFKESLPKGEPTDLPRPHALPVREESFAAGAQGEPHASPPKEEARRSEAEGAFAELEQLTTEWNIEPTRVAQALARPHREVVDLEAELHTLLQPFDPTRLTLEEALRELPMLLMEQHRVLELDVITSDQVLSDESAPPPGEAELSVQRTRAR